MNKKILFLILAALILINILVFYPSFSFSAKGDHIVFLMETAGMDDLGGLLLHTYSYCRTLIIFAGDRILFRPIFYAVLSIEKILWGYNFVLWQLTGFILHLSIVGLLLRLFYAMKPSRLAWGLTLFQFFQERQVPF